MPKNLSRDEAVRITQGIKEVYSTLAMLVDIVDDVEDQPAKIAIRTSITEVVAVLDLDVLHVIEKQYPDIKL